MVLWERGLKEKPARSIKDGQRPKKHGSWGNVGTWTELRVLMAFNSIPECLIKFGSGPVTLGACNLSGRVEHIGPQRHCLRSQPVEKGILETLIPLIIAQVFGCWSSLLCFWVYFLLFLVDIRFTQARGKFVFPQLRFSSQVQCYDPEENKWTLLPPTPFYQRCISAVCLDNIIYVVGGLLSKIFSYDPREDSWQEVATLPGPLVRKRFRKETLSLPFL